MREGLLDYLSTSFSDKKVAARVISWMREVTMTGRSRQIVLVVASVVAVAFVSWLIFIAFDGATIDKRMSTLNPLSDQAQSYHDVYVLVWWLSGAVFVVIMAATLILSILYRERPGVEPRRDIHGNTRLEILWTIIPIVIVLIMVVPTFEAVLSVEGDAEEGALEVTATGHQWWFEFTYHDSDGNELFRTANEMHVPVEKAVNVSLVSNDVIHAFWVPALFGKKDMMPGHNNRLWFKSKPGTEGMHYGQCVEYCGDSHANMRFRIFVESAADYDAWVANQIAKAKWSDDELVSAGREVFVAKACNSCHQVEYSKSDAPDWLIPPTVAAIGPNLSHLASRTTIASALLDRDESSLRAWLKNPPAIKPGSRMPNLELTDDEITKLIAMLDSLE